MQPQSQDLAPLVGEWSVEMVAPDASPSDLRGRVVFQWMDGERFLVQRWEVPSPYPGGIAIIGFDEGRDTYLQHYFDTRGVARVYEMTLGDGVWALSRVSADFSPLDFLQRFTGTFADEGSRIDGRWEICHDGSTWEHDFDLIYARVA